MASKPSKKTLALLAQFPAFDAWIINNLTPDQLIEVRDSQIGMTSFGGGHLLNSQALGVQLWRAYKPAVVFELRNRWPGGLDYSSPPAGGDRLVFFHQAVCTAIGLYVVEQPELLDRTVERMRREIETATGPAQPPTYQSVAAERRNRL